MKNTILCASLCTSILCLTAGLNSYAQKTRSVEKATPKVIVANSDKTLNTQWAGKKVAFLGDSMTDKRRVGTTCVYWEYLEELLGIHPSVYGISGNQWNDIYKQAVKLYREKNPVDAILIFAGTNDYNHGVPVGRFYEETSKETNFNGQTVTRKYRIPILDDTTFCGRINKAMQFLKDSFPKQQIIIMTPIHRAQANFNSTNVQPDERYSNGQGLYVDTYINILKQAASNWSVPCIDLYSLSGLYPLSDSYVQFFHNGKFDRLHPNANGDYRLARTIQYQLLALPSTFNNIK